MGLLSFFIGAYYYVLSVFSFVYILFYPITRFITGKFSKNKIDPNDPFVKIGTYKHEKPKHRPLYATAALSASVVPNPANNNAVVVKPGLASEVVEEGVSSSGPQPFNLGLPLASFPFVTEPTMNHGNPIIPFIQKSLITNDGLVINYYILYPGNPRTMVFANGLGAKASFDSFAPILKRYATTDGDWSFITWDYRGLFHSQSVHSPNHLSVHYHCEDLNEILIEENISKIDCMVGYSIGSQVALQMALSYPQKVGKLLLLNGTYGKIFDTIFQPLFRLPFANDIIQSVLNILITYPLLLKIELFFLKPFAYIISFFYNIFFGSPYMRSMIGTNYLYQFGLNYFIKNNQSVTDVINYFQLLQDFDAHTVHHLLKFIGQPTMIVGGLLDTITPVYQSFELSQSIPNSKLIIAPCAGHSVLLESPDRTLLAIKELVETDNDWMNKYTVPSEEEKKRILKGVVKDIVETFESKESEGSNNNNINNNGNKSNNNKEAGGKKGKGKGKGAKNNNNAVFPKKDNVEGTEGLETSWTDVSSK